MKRIYVVDGDRLMNDLIRRAFSRQEIDFTDFASPTDALAAVRANPPDLLITEINLEGMSGFDLAAAIRNDAAPRLPVIFITAHPSADLAERALAVGVRNVVKKPVDSLGELSAAVRREMFYVEANNTVRHLDVLRSEFLIDLSHQLRTPLTAMKLAMDGLFAQLEDVMNASQRNLANISRRNIERIVALVEHQLSALQMMTDERRVCRRLVDLSRLVLAGPKRWMDESGDRYETPVEIVTGDGLRADGTDTRLRVFTDPELLTTVVDCVLGAGPPNSRRTVRLDYDSGAACCYVDVLVERPVAPETLTDVDKEEPITRGEEISTFDFEYRAYRSLMNQIGGEATIHTVDDHKWIRLRLPRYPAWDRDKDFMNPVKNIWAGGSGFDRSAKARASVHTVHIIKCDLGERVIWDYLDTEDPVVRDFVGRVVSAVSSADAVVRSKDHGKIYLALRDRSPQELDRVVSFLRNGGSWREDGGVADAPHVWEPQRVVVDGTDVDRLAPSLELV